MQNTTDTEQKWTANFAAKQQARRISGISTWSTEDLKLLDTTKKAGAQPENVRTKYEVTMDSITYGAEVFEYDTLREAYEAVSRLALKCRDLKDEIVRTFYVSEI